MSALQEGFRGVMLIGEAMRRLLTTRDPRFGHAYLSGRSAGRRQGLLAMADVVRDIGLADEALLQRLIDKIDPDGWKAFDASLSQAQIGERVYEKLLAYGIKASGSERG